MPSTTNTIVVAVSAITGIGAILGLWWDIENKIESSIKQSTDLITTQIVHDATQLAELHIADLEVRSRILRREIASYPDGKAPERMYILLDALASQILETKEKKW